MNYLLSALGLVGVLIVIFVPFSDMAHCSLIQYSCFRGRATPYLFWIFFALAVATLVATIITLIRHR